MTATHYADWLARGRAHQQAGRIIDALLCYRQALQQDATGLDARFHAGEIAWRLGDPDGAITAWQAATGIAPDHVPSLHALADALTATGRFDAAREVVGRVLGRRPGEARAAPLSVLLKFVAGEPFDDGALADAVAHSTALPISLVAAVLAQIATDARKRYPVASGRLAEAAAAIPVPPTGIDALRGIALALHGAGLDAASDAFAAQYARAGAWLARLAMPLLWPRRTAGTGLRIGVLARTDEHARVDVVAGAARKKGGCELTVFDRGSPGGGAEAIAQGAQAGPDDAESSARAIAVRDLDVLIDVSGMRARNGVLLARRPARSLWAIRFEGVPVAVALYDRVFDAARGSQILGDALDEALAEAERVSRAQPATVEDAATLAAWRDEAVLAHQRGDLAGAHHGYARVLDVQPESVATRLLDGSLAGAEGDGARARSNLRSVIDDAPAFVDAHVALAAFELGAHRAEAASDAARAGLSVAPESPGLWRTLGQAELKRNAPQAAITAFAEALLRDPAHGETHYNHGVALQMARDHAEAARAYQRAIAFMPELSAAHFNLGVLFDQRGHRAAAANAFTNALALAPAHAAAYKALGETLLAAGRIDAWYANYDRFERHCPHHLSLAAQALEVCAYRGDFVRLSHYIDGLRDERFSDGEPLEILDALQQILYLLHFFDTDDELLERLGHTHDVLAIDVYGEPMPRHDARVSGPLRIGYLSGDFRDHVMGRMMWEVLRRHDRARFRVFGYATSGARDEWTARYESVVERLERLDALADGEAAARISEDDLDLLVDLSTHTRGARPGILALKPARVQVTHVASAGTLAMSAIDFKLTDRFADVNVEPVRRIETPLVMDGCVYPYRHVDSAPPGLFSRDRLGIAPSAVVIGAFVTPLKLSQRCLALWRDVLKRLPGAVLAFSPLHPALRTVFRRICAVADIDDQRIAFVPQGRNAAENQARYRLVDLVLDPMPYGGVNGTLEALDMGVPVVTLVGRRHAERTSYSILTNLGVTDTIAQTGVEYVEIAARLATDAAFAAAVRSHIADGLAQSPLTDMTAHVRHLESAFVDALARRAPQALQDVSAAAARDA